MYPMLIKQNILLVSLVCSLKVAKERVILCILSVVVSLGCGYY